MRRRCRTPDDPEEFYDHQLIGLAAWTGTGATSAPCPSVLHPPAAPVLQVHRPDGSQRARPVRRPRSCPRSTSHAGRLVVDAAGRNVRLRGVDADRASSRSFPRTSTRCGSRCWARRSPMTSSQLARARPAGLDHRPAPHRRRLAVRRRPRHGDEARRVGTGAGRRCARRSARRWSCRRPPGGCSPSPRPTELATAAHLVVRLRPVRGHRPAGDHDAATRMPVLELSIGDYVLAGGEVGRDGDDRGDHPADARACWAIPDSAGEDSFSGELRHCSRRPATPARRCTGACAVPAVLTSGDHAAVAALPAGRVPAPHRGEPARPASPLGRRRPGAAADLLRRRGSRSGTMDRLPSGGLARVAHASATRAGELIRRHLRY